MTTRQELLTGINLIRHICRLNKHTDGLTSLMQYIEPYKPDKELDGAGFKNFAEHKDEVRKLNDFMDSLSDRINIVLIQVDSKYLDNGIAGIGVIATYQKITADNQAVKTLVTNARSLIQSASERQDLDNLASPFESYNSECGTMEPNPWQIIPVEANHANILQSVLNAMKYELQGLNENTGQPHGLTVKQIKARVSTRVNDGYVYHSHLTDDLEPVGTPNKAKMGSVLSYIKANLNSATSFLDLELLGQNIGINISSVPSVRRWWAL